MDILVSLKDLWINFIFWLKPGISLFVIRMGLMLAIIFALLNLTLTYIPARTVFVQVCAACLGIIISVNLSLDSLRNSGGSFVLIFTFCFLILIFLPGWLPAYIVPVYGHQLRLRKIIKYIVWGLFILQILIG